MSLSNNVNNSISKCTGADKTFVIYIEVCLAGELSDDFWKRSTESAQLPSKQGSGLQIRCFVEVSLSLSQTLDLAGKLRSQELLSNPSPAKSKWAVVRMVFKFHLASRNYNIRAWRETVFAVQLQIRDAKAKEQSLLALKRSLHTSDSRSSGESSSSTMSAIEI